MTAFLLFVAGLGLGLLLGLTLAWAHWARVLEGEQAAHTQVVTRLTRELRPRLEEEERVAAQRVAVALSRLPTRRPTRTRES